MLLKKNRGAVSRVDNRSQLLFIQQVNTYFSEFQVVPFAGNNPPRSF